MQSSQNPHSTPYVRWLRRWATSVLVASALVAAASGYLAVNRLPLETDLASLLPPDAPAVRDLRRLQERVPSQDEVITLVVADDPRVRAEVAAELRAGYEEIGDGLIARIEADDAETRAFLREHVHLYAPLDDLVRARDALKEHIEKRKLEANPLYVDLEDEDDDEASAAEDELDRIRADLDEARADLEHSGFVSDDGTVQLIIVRAAFPRTQVESTRELVDRMRAVRDRVLANHARDDVEVGLTGGLMSALAELEALRGSMLLSAAITVALVVALLLVFFRSLALVLFLTVAFSVGVIASFGVATLTVGHLNLATAFLVAIVAGNGVNYGILLLARYREERSLRGEATVPALGTAISGTVVPTLIASLGAAIAYGSLAITSFRGFSEFAVIGAVGMLLCWISAFTTLPALLLCFDRRAHAPARPSALGRLLARLPGSSHPRAVLVAVAIVTAASAAITYSYIAGDPMEYDAAKLRSDSAMAEEIRTWKRLSNDHFGRDIHGATYIATESPEQVYQVVDALRAIDGDAAAEDRVIGSIHSREQAIPLDQPQKRAVLAEIRTLLDDDVLFDLEPEARADLEALRPPDELGRITEETLPEQLASKLRERDGRIGLLIRVRPGPSLRLWHGPDLERYAAAIREIELADGTTITTSGSAIIFADIIAAIRADGLRASALAALLVVVLVLGLAGRRRAAVAVLLATAVGTLVMVAAAALIGLKVNFLDFVALPITIGLGVDYGINIAHRLRGSAPDPLATTGGAVVLCSLTTIIAYGSLLVSANPGVRSFGLAALIGEAACVLAALLVVPAVLAR